MAGRKKLGQPGRQGSLDVWQRLLAKGEPMKDFELTSFDGGKVRLSALRGKVVLVNFFGPL